MLRAGGLPSKGLLRGSGFTSYLLPLPHRDIAIHMVDKHARLFDICALQIAWQHHGQCRVTQT